MNPRPPVSGEPSTERATWQRLTTALRRFAESKADDDWQEVESAMQARDDFHRAEARATPPSLDDDNPVLRLLEVVMSLRRMVKDGHPDDRSWFRIMSENLSSVMDLTDMALMDGNEAVVALLTNKEERP